MLSRGPSRVWGHVISTASMLAHFCRRALHFCLAVAAMDGAPDSPEARQARKQHIAKRKRELEDELQVIHSQRQRIEHHLQSLTAAPGLAAGPSKARGPSKASQPLIFGGGPAERQHIETEREKRITGLFAQCITILRNVKTNQKAGSFIEPVDPVKLKIFDYFDFVKTPMALNDVQGKLAHAPAKGIFRKYKSVLEFRDDMRQIWENCRIYNPIGQPVRTNGDHLSDFWEKKWQQSQLEQKWEAEMLLQKQEELVRHTSSCFCNTSRLWAAYKELIDMKHIAISAPPQDALSWVCEPC